MNIIKSIAKSILPDSAIEAIQINKNRRRFLRRAQERSAEIYETGGDCLAPYEYELRDNADRLYDDLFSDSVGYFQDICGRFAAEFNRFELGIVQNEAFASGDWEAYYSVVRANKPSLVIEIGPGFSTHACNEAIKVNGKGKIIAIAPSGWDYSIKGEFIKSKIEDVNPVIFDRLKAGDILFIDSSHTGIEATYHIENILPRLQSGALVHHHDVLYPYKAHHEEEEVLLDFYKDNQGIYSVLFGTAYMHYMNLESLRGIMPNFRYNLRRIPGSLWVVKK